MLYEYQKAEWARMVDSAKIALESDCPLIEDEVIVRISRLINQQAERIAELERERDMYKNRCDEIAETATHMIIGGVTEEKVNEWLDRRDTEQQIKGVMDYIATLDRNLDKKVYLKTVEKDARMYCEHLRKGGE